MKLFVVLGEFGEYSNREVFVSGVYETKKEAEAAVLSAGERNRDQGNWTKEMVHLMKVHAVWSGVPFFEAKEKVSKLMRPEPNESIERCEIFEVEVGKWYSDKLEGFG